MAAIDTTGLRAVGMNDEQTECDACGRTELRGTVMLADADGAIVYRLGTTCASRALGIRLTRRDATSIELARRSRVANLTRSARADLTHGRLASAAEHLDDAVRAGLLHATEAALVADVRALVLAAREALPQRWGFSRDGHAVVELDSREQVAEVVARAATAPYRTEVVAHRLVDGAWVPATL
ncbi:hypothetical protein [Cellulosimicrobium sp. Marseille-Q4280]|uniref:hypothetical protein n=1 Tax=Cellulosimicrobium sp. Marseille-Q4280 TaxID=2937992 RepID=UPI00204174AB|nr:hypothetical protein [Cellulosimicrobium sp. Marseille-Q4280]